SGSFTAKTGIAEDGGAASPASTAVPIVHLLFIADTPESRPTARSKKQERRSPSPACHASLCAQVYGKARPGSADGVWRAWDIPRWSWTGRTRGKPCWRRPRLVLPRISRDSSRVPRPGLAVASAVPPVLGERSRRHHHHRQDNPRRLRQSSFSQGKEVHPRRAAKS